MDRERNPDLDTNSVDPEASGELQASTPDPNDEIPVPIAMFPSEIDERAQVVDALRKEANTDRGDEIETQA